MRMCSMGVDLVTKTSTHKKTRVRDSLVHGDLPQQEIAVTCQNSGMWCVSYLIISLLGDVFDPIQLE